MKRAGQRWAIKRGRRMARLRAAYRTAGPRRFHWPIREALKPAPALVEATPLSHSRWRERRRASN